MDRGDIYAVRLDPIQGREQAGHRRVLVLSPLAFNRRTGTPLVAPITGGGGLARAIGFSVPLTGAGLTSDGVVRCDQVRTLDLQARNARKVETAPAFIVDEVIARVATLLE